MCGDFLLAGNEVLYPLGRRAWTRGTTNATPPWVMRPITAPQGHTIARSGNWTSEATLKTMTGSYC